MSVAIPITGYGIRATDGSAAVSDTGQTIKRRWNEEQNVLRLSASDWLPTVSAELHDIADECSSENWDGHGAFAVSPETRVIAQSMLAALYAIVPRGTPVPDIVAESDGEISISWVTDVDHTFSVSVGSHGKANFAGQFGKEGSVHAWRPLDTSSWEALEESLEDISRYVGRLYKSRARRSAA
jgi:hypothetical protein